MTLSRETPLKESCSFSSVLKYFHPNKSRYDGDQVTIFRTIHMITGGTLNNKLAGAATKIMSAQTRTHKN